MDYIALLSEEHPELPLAELDAALAADGIDADIDKADDGIAVLTGADVPAVADRLAMTFEIAERCHTVDPANYQKLAATDLQAEQPFAVRVVRVDDTAAPDELEQNVGRIIDRHSDAAVELDQPEEEFRVYLHGGDAHICRLAAAVDRGAFEARQNQYRPYSSPITIHPRLARALVNLSQVPRDGALLDPFCGTGGILLEAGLIGCDVYGTDVQEEMVDGAAENLGAFGVEADIRQADAADAASLFDQEFGAVVTDLPYGKASAVEGDPAETVRGLADELAGGAAVFMSDDGAVDGIEPAFEIFVHRSMTRYVYVLE